MQVRKECDNMCRGYIVHTQAAYSHKHNACLLIVAHVVVTQNALAELWRHIYAEKVD